MQAKPLGKASPHFSWASLLLLPQWGVYHDPSEEERANLIKLANKMEEVREFFDHPINVLCAIRPTHVQAAGTQWQGKNYNLLVQGAAQSAHIVGLAMDFTVSTVSCDEARFHLIEELERLCIRMEKKAGAGWVHVDLLKPHPNRYFVP